MLGSSFFGIPPKAIFFVSQKTGKLGNSRSFQRCKIFGLPKKPEKLAFPQNKKSGNLGNSTKVGNSGKLGILGILRNAEVCDFSKKSIMWDSMVSRFLKKIEF
jgi:hypothetical protein